MGDSRYTVLIVDDDREIVDLLTDHFTKRNGEAIATSDPVTVIHKLRNFSVKLMLLDLKMKKLDGFEVLERIKQAGLVLPPTIIITGYLPKYEDRLRSYGIDLKDVVTKPFNFEVMEECINRKLGQQIVMPEVGSEYENAIYTSNRCKIGFVEDEQDILDILSNFFKERHYKVSCYSNGTTAFEALKRDSVDVLFVDLKLPGISGDQLIKELSTASKPPHMIAMSADPIVDEMRLKLSECGVSEFIEKPFDVVQLIELVKTIAIEKKLLG